MASYNYGLYSLAFPVRPQLCRFFLFSSTYSRLHIVGTLTAYPSMDKRVWLHHIYGFPFFLSFYLFSPLAARFSSVCIIARFISVSLYFSLPLFPPVPTRRSQLVDRKCLSLCALSRPSTQLVRHRFDVLGRGPKASRTAPDDKEIPNKTKEELLARFHGFSSPLYLSWYV